MQVMLINESVSFTLQLSLAAAIGFMVGVWVSWMEGGAGGALFPLSDVKVGVGGGNIFIYIANRMV